MPNLIEWITDLSGQEPILGVVIGVMGWGDYGKEAVPNYDQMPLGKVLSWEDAKQWLDYDFSAGYGAPGCQAIYAWTQSYVIAISQYDGRTSPFRIPRNPINCMPYMPGS